MQFVAETQRIHLAVLKLAILHEGLLFNKISPQKVLGVCKHVLVSLDIAIGIQLFRFYFDTPIYLIKVVHTYTSIHSSLEKFINSSNRAFYAHCLNTNFHILSNAKVKKDVFVPTSQVNIVTCSPINREKL